MKYKSLFKKIGEILNEIDPYGLIVFGAPGNEYNQEITQIIAKLEKSKNIENFEKEVEIIFMKSFQEPPKKSILENLSQKIFSLKE